MIAYFFVYFDLMSVYIWKLLTEINRNSLRLLLSTPEDFNRNKIKIKIRAINKLV